MKTVVLFHTKGGGGNRKRTVYEGILDNGFNPEHYGYNIYSRFENESILNSDQLDLVLRNSYAYEWDEEAKKEFDALNFINEDGCIITHEDLGEVVVVNGSDNILDCSLNDPSNGYFDFDGDYDRWCWHPISECSLTEGLAIIDNELRFDGRGANLELLSDLTGLSKDVLDVLIRKGELRNEYSYSNGSIDEERIISNFDYTDEEDTEHDTMKFRGEYIVL